MHVAGHFHFLNYSTKKIIYIKDNLKTITHCVQGHVLLFLPGLFFAGQQIVQHGFPPVYPCLSLLILLKHPTPMCVFNRSHSREKHILSANSVNIAICFQLR